MAQDAKTMRGDSPFVFTNLKISQGLETIQQFIQFQGRLPVPHAASV